MPSWKAENVEQACAFRKDRLTAKPVIEDVCPTAHEALQQQRRQREVVASCAPSPGLRLGEILLLGDIGLTHHHGLGLAGLENHAQHFHEGVGARQMNAGGSRASSRGIPRCRAASRRIQCAPWVRSCRSGPRAPPRLQGLRQSRSTWSGPKVVHSSLVPRTVPTRVDSAVLRGQTTWSHPSPKGGRAPCGVQERHLGGSPEPNGGKPKRG